MHDIDEHRCVKIKPFVLPVRRDDDLRDGNETAMTRALADGIGSHRRPRLM